MVTLRNIVICVVLSILTVCTLPLISKTFEMSNAYARTYADSSANMFNSYTSGLIPVKHRKTRFYMIGIIDHAAENIRYLIINYDTETICHLHSKITDCMSFKDLTEEGRLQLKLMYDPRGRTN